MYCVILGTRTRERRGIEFRVTATETDHHELIGTTAVLNKKLARSLFLESQVFKGESAQRDAVAYAKKAYPEAHAKDRIRVITFCGAVFPES
jgi:hypothetical protein